MAVLALRNLQQQRSRGGRVAMLFSGQIGGIAAAVVDVSFLLTLAAVAGRSEADLQRALDQLVAAGLIFRRGAPPRASLQFKHALVQDAAYATLLRSRRQELHARIARVLEETFTDIVETQPELLAHHYTQAGLTEQAIGYWQRAGERALERSANREASRHFGHGIELIKSLPPSPDRTRREFRLYLGLGPAIRTIKGHAAPETMDAFTRARAVARDSQARVAASIESRRALSMAYSFSAAVCFASRRRE